ncbi:hypothetical protein PJI16_17000 [Nitrospira sp. MA-1]|nr:hypothetical protein [Nitrospira sp. MA-1]
MTEIHTGKIEGVFKNVRPARLQPNGRAERTEEYVSTARRRKRRWRHFSTLPIRGIYPYSHTGRIVTRFLVFAPTAFISIQTQ